MNLIKLCTLWGGIGLVMCLLISCELKGKKDLKKDISDVLVERDTISVGDSYDSILMNEESIILPNTVKTKEVSAYDKLFFGMQKEEVESLNKSREKIGLYSYNFVFKYNGDGELYRIDIKSSSEKTIHYETHLQAKYANLCRVVSEKYGKKSLCGALPSIFEVMNAKQYKMVEWQSGEKAIILYLVYASMDAYYTECRIVHKSMEKAEKERLYRVRNKDIIESSEKF